MDFSSRLDPQADMTQRDSSVQTVKHCLNESREWKFLFHESPWERLEDMCCGISGENPVRSPMFGAGFPIPPSAPPATEKRICSAGCQISPLNARSRSNAPSIVEHKSKKITSEGFKSNESPASPDRRKKEPHSRHLLATINWPPS